MVLGFVVAFAAGINNGIIIAIFVSVVIPTTAVAFFMIFGQTISVQDYIGIAFIVVAIIIITIGGLQHESIDSTDNSAIEIESQRISEG